jgi:hypothetical protein
MSRSRKKRPGGGIAIADSDKPFKLQEHKRERRAVRVILNSRDEDNEPPHPKGFGNPWDSCKDGKQYWPDHNAKWMRK